MLTYDHMTAKERLRDLKPSKISFLRYLVTLLNTKSTRQTLNV